MLFGILTMNFALDEMNKPNCSEQNLVVSGTLLLPYCIYYNEYRLSRQTVFNYRLTAKYEKYDRLNNLELYLCN